MLFLLTGGVQTGKTRWLEQLLAELADDGVESQGVVAPGVWRQRGGEDGAVEELDEEDGGDEGREVTTAGARGEHALTLASVCRGSGCHSVLPTAPPDVRTSAQWVRRSGLDGRTHCALDWGGADPAEGSAGQRVNSG